MFTDEKTWYEMENIAEELSNEARSIAENIGYSSDIYDDIVKGVHEHFVCVSEDDVIRTFENDINGADTIRKDVVGDIKDFDAKLIKLIALRLQYALEADTPLNLSKSKEWARLVEYAL